MSKLKKNAVSAAQALVIVFGFATLGYIKADEDYKKVPDAIKGAGLGIVLYGVGKIAEGTAPR